MKDLYNMELHDSIEINKYLYAIRVPGGWIYQSYNPDYETESNVFVPYNNEFQENKDE